MNDNAKAMQYWQALLTNGYNKPGVFVELARLSKIAGDTAAALTYLQQGRSAHPNDIGLVIDELNIYLIQGKQEMAIEKLTAAIALDPSMLICISLEVRLMITPKIRSRRSRLQKSDRAQS